jgi:4-amino-4-deoxy-L-arabinose transferase-like glycosyltransferase
VTGAAVRVEERAASRRGVPLFATGPVLGVAAAAALLLLAVASRYGYHRDELYFLAAARHLDWGYVDQPPFAVLVAWLDRFAFGDGLVGLRLVPALVVGAGVAVTGLMARELGGSRFAQGFAAACAASAGFLVVGHLEGPTVYDALTWALVSWLILRILRTGDDRLWLAVGLTVGIGMEAKQTVPLLLLGLAVGFLVNRQQVLFTSRWLWAGVGVAILGWAPNLVWEATNGWPTLEMDANLRTEHSGLGYALKYPFITLLAMGALLAPVWLAGAWALWRDERFHRFRAFAVAFSIGFVALWIAVPDRFYYLFGIYPVLFAAGAIVTEEVTDGSRGFFRQVPKHRWLWRSHRAAIAILVVDVATFLPIGLPALPQAAVAAADLQKVNYNLGEEIGWPAFVHQVADVWQSLPPRGRAHAVLLTSNYGEAGALIRYGDRYGLPTAYSGHNSFWWWGPPTAGGDPTIAVGFARADLIPHFRSCRLSARVHNAAGVHNDEDGAPIWTCLSPKASWASMWPAFRQYG